MAVLARDHYLTETILHWRHISPIIHEPKNKKEYEALADMLDKLLDIVGENESHELLGLIDVISHMLTMHDELHKNYVQQKNGINALKFLMQQHGLTQSDLKNEIGSQGVVSEILNGKRELNLTHIKKLALRFGVNPETFID